MKENSFIGCINNKIKYYINKNSNDRSFKIIILINIRFDCEMQCGNGIYHLLEHMCLSYDIFDKRDFFINKNDIINPNDFILSGSTDYDRIVLEIEVLNTNNSIDNSFYILNKIFDGSIINNSVLDRVKNDIMRECVYFKDRDIVKSKIIKFISDGEVKQLPIGDIKKIKNITIEQLKRCHKDVFYMNRLGIIVSGNVNLNKIKQKLYILETILDKKYMCCNSIYNKEIKKTYKDTKIFRLHSYTKKIVTVEVFYKLNFKDSSIEDRLKKYFFNNMLSNYIGNQFNRMNIKLEKINCIDKRNLGLEDYYMIVYKVENKFNIFKVYSAILKKLIKIKFEESEYFRQIQELKNLLKKIHYANEDELDNVIIHEYIYNYFYGEPVFDMKKDYEKIINAMDSIKIEDINNLIEIILNNNFRFVIK